MSILDRFRSKPKAKQPWLIVGKGATVDIRNVSVTGYDGIQAEAEAKVTITGYRADGEPQPDIERKPR